MPEVRQAGPPLMTDRTVDEHEATRGIVVDHRDLVRAARADLFEDRAVRAVREVRAVNEELVGAHRLGRQEHAERHDRDATQGAAPRGEAGRERDCIGKPIQLPSRSG